MPRTAHDSHPDAAGALAAAYGDPPTPRLGEAEARTPFVAGPVPRAVEVLFGSPLEGVGIFAGGPGRAEPRRARARHPPDDLDLVSGREGQWREWQRPESRLGGLSLDIARALTAGPIARLWSLRRGVGRLRCVGLPIGPGLAGRLTVAAQQANRQGACGGEVDQGS